MRNYTAIVDRCTETGLFTGFIPGFQGAHTQGETLDELHQNRNPMPALARNQDKTVKTLQGSAMAPQLDIYKQDHKDQPRRFHQY